MARKRKKRQTPEHVTLYTNEQLATLIPGGSVNPHLAEQLGVEVDVTAKDGAGNPLLTRQHTASLVKKLFDANLIGPEELRAAKTQRWHHDMAFGGNMTGSWQMPVDSSGGGGDAMTFKLDCVQQFENSMIHLGPELSAVAWAGIIERPPEGFEGSSLLAIGRTLVGDSVAPAESRGAAKGALVHVTRALASFYVGHVKDAQTRALFQR